MKNTHASEGQRKTKGLISHVSILELTATMQIVRSGGGMRLGAEVRVWSIWCRLLQLVRAMGGAASADECDVRPGYSRRVDRLRVLLRSLSRSQTVSWMRSGSRSETRGRRHSQMSERWTGDTAGWSTQARLARLKVRVG
jgi:hypothetical protein